MLQTSSPKKDTTSGFVIWIGDERREFQYRCPEDMLRALRVAIKIARGKNAIEFWDGMKEASLAYGELKGEAPKQNTS